MKATIDKERRRATHIRKRDEAPSKLATKVKTLGDDALLDEYETAAFLDVSVQWLRNRRINGRSLPFLKIGQSVRYRLGDLKLGLTSKPAA